MAATAPHRRGRLAALSLGALGFCLFFRVELGSGLDRSKGFQADDRLIHFLMEWVSLCVTSDPVCRNLWSPPVFYPEPGTLAFTDPSLGLGVLYSGLRALGAGRGPAFVLTQMLLLALAYAAALWMLRHALRFSWLPAAAGALLFAFGAPVAAQADHPQLFALFPIPLVVGALARLLEEDDPRLRRRYSALAAGALVALGYLNLTLFWLLGFSLFWATVAGLCLTSTRRRILALVRAQLPFVGAALLLAGAALLPLLLRMFEARQRVGGAHELEKWYPFVPQPESWLNLSADNWIWGPLSSWRPIRDLPFPWEHQLGIGLVTTAICLLGAWWSRQNPAARALSVTVAIVGLVSLRWPGGFTLWTWVHDFWPGAESVRAVGRVALVLLAPAAVALAFVFQRLLPRHRLLAALVGLVVLLEQQRSFSAYSLSEAERRVLSLANLIPAECRAFFWSPLAASSPGSVYQTQVDAMWAAVIARVPTANGYTGYAPVGWGLFEHRVEDSRRRQLVADQLSFWAAYQGLARGELCWIRTKGRDERVRLARVEAVDPALSPWPVPAPNARGGRR